MSYYVRVKSNGKLLAEKDRYYLYEVDTKEEATEFSHQEAENIVEKIGENDLEVVNL